MLCRFLNGVAFVYEDSLSRCMFMTAGTYLLAHSGLPVIIMLKRTLFRSVFLSEDNFKTGKVVEPEHCFVFYMFGVVVTDCKLSVMWLFIIIITIRVWIFW